MPNNWGWTSYTGQGWKRDDGRKLYLGRFMKIDGNFPVGPNAAMEKFKITFWARRPVLAMREIVRCLNAGEKIPAEVN